MNAKDDTHNWVVKDDPSLYGDMLIPRQTLLSSHKYLSNSLHEDTLMFFCFIIPLVQYIFALLITICLVVGEGW